MRLRALGKALPEVSEISLGTWGLSGDGYGPVPEAEQDKVIDRAIAVGITLFETADVYGDGAMETKLGQRLPARVHVATKIGTDRAANPPRKCFEPQFLRESFDKSRERLKRDIIDIVLLHNPVEATVASGEATAVLAELKHRGRVRAWGVSAGSLEVARAAIAAGAEVLSLTVNAFCSAELKALHDDIVAKNVGVIAHSALSHGLLAGYWSLHKEFSPGDHRGERWTADELRRRVQQLSALRPLVAGNVPTMRAAALRYVLALPDIGTVVIGPRAAIQLDQQMRETNREPPFLTDDQLRSFAFRLQQVGVKT